MNIKGLFYKTTLDALIASCNVLDHNYDLKNITLIKRELNLLGQRCVDGALICIFATVNLSPDIYNISHLLTDILLSECWIFNSKSDVNMNKSKRKIN